MLFTEVVKYSHKIAATASKNAKAELIVDFLRKLSATEAEIGIDFITGYIRQGKIDLGWGNLKKLYSPSTSGEKAYKITKIDEYLEIAKKARGEDKLKVLRPLFATLGPSENDYLVSLIIGEVRHGAGEGVVKMAVAKFFEIDLCTVENALMYIPDIGKLFKLLLTKGKKVLEDISIQLFKPVKPMLADIAESTEELLTEFKELAFEYKLDGIRIQVHKDNEEVRIFSRHLNDITNQFPEIVEISKELPVGQFIIDGEAIGVDENGNPLSFQLLSRRIMRIKQIDSLKTKIPVVPNFFDALFIDGEDLTGRSYSDRIKALDELIPSKEFLIERKVSNDMKDAKSFFNNSISYGHEGIMAKVLDSPYRAGKRGKYWFKIKKAHTIECVVLAAEWGHGRRRGYLSNLHLGVLDESGQKFLMVGKTFKGLTDALLRWQTKKLLELKVHEDSWIVYVKPEVVVEIAFDNVQKSPKYSSGYALRFARVKRVRGDKSPYEINTIMDIEKIHQSEIFLE